MKTERPILLSLALAGLRLQRKMLTEDETTESEGWVIADDLVNTMYGPDGPYKGGVDGEMDTPWEQLELQLWMSVTCYGCPQDAINYMVETAEKMIDAICTNL